MPDFEIYFCGLMCFICKGGFYDRVILVDDADHKPIVWLGPTAQKLANPIDLAGETISLELTGNGPSCDSRALSPLVHLKPLIDGSPQLLASPPNAATVLLPDGTLDVPIKMDGTSVLHSNGSLIAKQSVAQLVVVKVQNDGSPLKISVGTQSDIVSASSFMVVGNLSGAHDSTLNNHAKKYIHLTKGGTGIGMILGGDT